MFMRGNVLQGLRKIRETGQSIGVPIRVYGPETHITAVVPMALGLVDGASVPEFDQTPKRVSAFGGARWAHMQ